MYKPFFHRKLCKWYFKLSRKGDKVNEDFFEIDKFIAYNRRFQPYEFFENNQYCKYSMRLFKKKYINYGNK